MAAGGRGKFYAVRRGRKQGVFRTWEECREQTERYPGSVFKSFPTESEAWSFVNGATKRSGDDTSSAPGGGAPPAKTPRYDPRKRVRPAAHDHAEDDNVNDNNPLQDQVSISIKPTAAAGSASVTTTSSNAIHTNDTTQVAAATTNTSASAAAAAEKDTIVVYTDGSSRGNGRFGAVAGYGVYWEDPKYHHLNISKRLAGKEQTNNRAELQAIIAAVKACPDPSAKLRICTDSQYSINAVNSWMPKWRKNGWITTTGKPVLNKDLIVELDRVFSERPSRPELVYVRGHNGIHGNMKADELANLGAMAVDYS
ncbi:hypothetical protein MCUN1_003326 [Malassezia cuniculi]|uniref:Ribonuclease H n=1 Tax=Malassezia cuniculi TaxID=948313 RepID=A0AAF0J7B3_9BASI|nr:hypothetical protein MCUN1_003326 [Malassezia cuniculi]